MADLLGKLLARKNVPKRRAVLLGAAGLAVFGVLYAAFELGRYDAGYRVVDSVSSALTAGRRIRELEAEVAHQRQQLAAADLARNVDREGYKQVEQSLGDMQSQIERLKQDLSFYRGLVQPDSLVHVKVQQMQIVPQPQAGLYRLKFVLMQSGKPDDVVAGNILLTIDGLQGGKPQTLGLAQVSQGHRAALGYAFRYFEEYDEAVQLPAGFEATRIGTEIRSGRDAAHGFRQAFVWKAQGMSVETEPPQTGQAGWPMIDPAVRDPNHKGGAGSPAETE
jgi:uncharacterized coiled-coil protein SlyX